MSNRIKLPKRVKQALEQVGSYRLEQGGKHVRIYVNEVLAGIVPHGVRGDGEIPGRAMLNVVSQIRRAGRAVTC
jgi:hypothetical protein